MQLLHIKDLYVSVEGTPILRGLELSVPQGEVHAIMGPNGAGKSTLAKVIAGHPSYEITSGQILFRGEDLAALSPEERAHKGLFMSFQYPLEIAGVSNEQFLRQALNAKRKANNQPLLSEELFSEHLERLMERMQVRPEFRERDVNLGFSGGEKKRNEILQMALLEPDFAVLDETDSGLDIDAMRIVAEGVNSLRNASRSILLITHYQRLLDYITPDQVHVLAEGRIVRSGGAELAHDLEKRGYEWVLTS